MVIYNVTVQIESDIQSDWENWMTEVHIPDVLNTGFFLQAELRKVLIDHEDGDITYSVQYKCKDMQSLHNYHEQAAPRLQQEHTERYKGRYVAFRTVMEELASHQV